MFARFRLAARGRRALTSVIGYVKALRDDFISSALPKLERGAQNAATQRLSRWKTTRSVSHCSNGTPLRMAGRRRQWDFASLIAA